MGSLQPPPQVLSPNWLTCPSGVFISNGLNFNVNQFTSKEKSEKFKNGRLINPILSLVERYKSESYNDIDIYLCGNENFIKDLTKKLKSFNSMKIRLFSDSFLVSGS